MTTLSIPATGSNAHTESRTTQALLLALDAGSMRHRVIASNIANASVPGHVPQRVSFGQLMGDGLLLQPSLTPELRSSGQPAALNLDAEVAAMAQNSLHQQALLRALQRHLGLLSLAASDGRR